MFTPLSLIGWLVTGSFFLCSCGFFHKNDEADEIPLVKKNWKLTEALMNVDREFSAYSRDSGLKKAFLHYLDEEGVLLRPDHYPLQGADAFENLSNIDDKNISITWEVSNGDVAQGDDMGYTYGIYSVIDKEKQDTIQQGTYGMVWKRNKKGNWKIVMDTGSSGLGEKKDSLEKEKDFEQ